MSSVSRRSLFALLGAALLAPKAAASDGVALTTIAHPESIVPIPVGDIDTAALEEFEFQRARIRCAFMLHPTLIDPTAHWGTPGLV